MNVGATNNVNGTNNNAVSNTSSSGNILGKDDFLKLLITQLKSQDPLDPVDDKQFIAQMAQFSTLEQMQNMNKGMDVLRASNLIGKYVMTNKLAGVVNGVEVANGNTMLIVGNSEVSLDDVIGITNNEG